MLRALLFEEILPDSCHLLIPFLRSSHLAGEEYEGDRIPSSIHDLEPELDQIGLLCPIYEQSSLLCNF